jgi:NADPH:quinone reductase-like Zn-dependent oxidoreductase
LKASVLGKFGEPEVLSLRDLPDPEPGPGQVRVRIRAAGVNFFDTEIRGGLMPGLTLPHVLGLDGAGVVDATGDDVDRARAGEMVLIRPFITCGGCPACATGREQMCERMSYVGVNMPGTYAELVCVPASAAVPFEGLSFEEAACVPVPFSTAWHILVNRARLRPGSSLLVVGAAGAIGTAAVQIGRLCGARVFAATSRPAAAKTLQELGADAVFDYRDEGAWEKAVQANGGHGLDYVLDNGGGASIGRSLAMLAPGGAVLVVGGVRSDHVPDIDLRGMWRGHRSLIASGNGSRSDLQAVLGEVARGRLHPVLAGTFPLADAAAAHHLLSSRERTGKIVLTP